MTGGGEPGETREPVVASRGRTHQAGAGLPDSTACCLSFRVTEPLFCAGPAARKVSDPEPLLSFSPSTGHTDNRPSGRGTSPGSPSSGRGRL